MDCPGSGVLQVKYKIAFVLAQHNWALRNYSEQKINKCIVIFKRSDVAL